MEMLILKLGNEWEAIMIGPGDKIRDIDYEQKSNPVRFGFAL